uniref:Immunoglobulin V-set domain-containing protein n=1 Tax=Oncorhynchus mykiss TaxID=8022 RepID=A0A8C7PD25_ONCMY
LGDTAILLCNISYHYKITWLKHNPEQTPAVLLCVSLNGGNIIYGHRPNLRFETEIANRSLALKIKSVEDADLGLYYCMGKIGESMMVGGGSRLHGKWGFLLVKNTCNVNPCLSHILLLLASPALCSCTPGLSFAHLHAAVVGLGLLGMILTVCITHHKTKKRNMTT